MYYKVIQEPVEWKKYLAKDSHWKDEFSAKELAYCWQDRPDDFPRIVKKVFRQDSTNVEFILGIPEYKVGMPGLGRASQNDIFVLATLEGRLCPIMVEGKRDEPLGEYCGSTYLNDGTGGRLRRYQQMISKLQLSVKPDGDDRLRYQLLHRTLSAIYTAEKFATDICMVMVHRINSNYAHCQPGQKSKDSFTDYEYFLRLYGINAQKDCIQTARIGKVDVKFLWIEDVNTYSNGRP